MRWQDDLQFYCMHFMPYDDPRQGTKDDDPDSFWVDYSNSHFDPHYAHELYQRYHREMQMVDELGFDAVVVNEHHSSMYSMNPSCNLAAAALIPQIKRAKICVFGVPITLVPPNRLAEEYAMLDVMSGGRLELAIPLGTGMEYWSNQADPVTARERFKEAVKVMVQAWTRPGPTEFRGKYYNFKYLNTWPQPMQKPHPKISIVGSGTEETIRFAAENGWGYASVFVPIKRQLESFKRMEDMAAKHGHTVTPDQRMMNTIIHVAETKEQAEAEAIPHIRRFFEVNLRTTPRYLNPPGYVSLDEFRIRAGAANAAHGGFDWEGLNELWRVAVGTPEMVAEKIYKWCDEANSNRIIMWAHLSSMPHWMVAKHLNMFAEQVMPMLRKDKLNEKRKTLAKRKTAKRRAA